MSAQKNKNKAFSLSRNAKATSKGGNTSMGMRHETQGSTTGGYHKSDKMLTTIRNSNNKDLNDDGWMSQKNMHKIPGLNTITGVSKTRLKRRKD